MTEKYLPPLSASPQTIQRFGQPVEPIGTDRQTIELTGPEQAMATFLSTAEAIWLHGPTILNYFLKRNTNASAESLNAKLKISSHLSEEAETRSSIYLELRSCMTSPIIS